MVGTKAMVYKDFSELIRTLNEKNQVHFDCAKDRNVEVTKQQDEVLRKKRASLMSDPNNIFVFEEGTNILHDRTCRLTSKIADKDFRMANKVLEGFSFCERCYLTAILRESVKNTKEIEACEAFLKMNKVDIEDVKFLVVDNEAMLKRLNFNSLWIKVREDEWIIESFKDAKPKLWHNSYTIGLNGERNFLGGFHLQDCGKDCSIHNYIKTIVNYDYNTHKNGIKLNVEAITYQIECIIKHDRISASNRLLKYMCGECVNKETKEQLLSLFNKIYKDEQVKIIKKGLDKGLNYRQMKLFVHPGCKCEQMKEIYSGYALNLSNTQVEQYAKYDLYAYEMKIRKWRYWFKNIVRRETERF